MKIDSTARRLLLRQHVARARELEALGLSRVAMMRLVDQGVLTRTARGLYSLAGTEGEANSALAAAAKRVPRGVVCLLSALQFHGLTTQLPRDIWLAIGEKDWRPISRDIRIRTVRFSPPSLREGVRAHRIDGVRVRIFNPAKTVADCFKYRNKIGLDVAIEALREGLRQRKCTVDDLWRYAKLDRVSSVMRPYIEALV